MLKVKRAIIGAALSALAFNAFTASSQAASIQRNYKYYTINGKSAEELDRALSRSGPLLKSTGHRHPGATEIRFDANVRYGKPNGKSCKVQDVRVNVYGTVSLPRWKQRRKASPELALIWDTLAADIKRHEESHLVIARAHASEMERRIKALYSRKDCSQLRADIDRISEKTLAEHDKAQAYFDKVETINFEDRFARLLTYRLEKMTGS